MTQRERMFRAAIRRLTEDYMAQGLPAGEAQQRAEAEAQIEYDRYCDELMDEQRLERGRWR